MSNIAGVDQEGRLVFHRGHMTQCLLEGAGHVCIYRLVEAQMTVTDLREAGAGLPRLGVAHDACPRKAAGDGPAHGTAGPGHALQESPPVGVVCLDAHVADGHVIVLQVTLTAIPGGAGYYSRWKKQF